MRIQVVFLTVLLSAALARADLITINFDTVPVLSPGADLFTQAGPAQTINVPGVATIGGGVVLDLASYLPGVPGVSGTNIYGTASNTVVGPGAYGLPDLITIGIVPGNDVTAASVPVINGMPGNQTFVVTAFAGANQISQESAVIGAFNSMIAELTGPGITSITISSLNSTRWDFFTDTIGLTIMPSSSGPSGGGTGPITVPEPGSAPLTAGGLIVAVALIWRLRS